LFTGWDVFANSLDMFVHVLATHDTSCKWLRLLSTSCTVVSPDTFWTNHILLKQIKFTLLLKKYKTLCVSVVCYLHVVGLLFFSWRNNLIVGLGLRIHEVFFLDHTQRHTTNGRTPLDEWSARRRDLYLTTHNTHNRQTSMLPVGFETMISAGERL